MNFTQKDVNYFEERLTACIKEGGLHTMKKKELQELAKSLQININNERLIYQLARSLFCYLIRQENYNYFIAQVWRKFQKIKTVVKAFSQQAKKDCYCQVHYNEIQTKSQSGQIEANLEFYISGINIPGLYNLLGGNHQDLSQQMKCICHNIQKVKQKLKNPGAYLTCICCHVKSHKECMEIQEQETYECPNCILKKMDPLTEVKAVLVEPSVLNSGLSTNLPFHISKENYDFLQSSGKIGLEIRCIRIDGKNNYETTWPDKAEIYLNNQRVAEIKPLQQNSSLKKRKDEKLFLREQKYYCAGDNKMEFKEQLGTSKEKQTLRIADHTHIIGVYLVKKLTVCSLVEQIDTKVIIPRLQSINEIKQQMNENNNSDDVCIDKLVISLKDAITQEPIEYPAKGKFCTHVQCFDLKNYLTIVDKLNPRKWNCPICKNRCFNLFVDGYMKDIIKGLKGPQNEVYFDKMGEFHFESIKNPNEDQNIYMEGKKNKKDQKTRYVKLEANDQIESIFNSGQNCYVLDEESDYEEPPAQKESIRDQPVEIIIDDSDEEVEIDKQGADEFIGKSTKAVQQPQDIIAMLDQTCLDLEKDIVQIDMQLNKNNMENNQQNQNQNQNQNIPSSQIQQNGKMVSQHSFDDIQSITENAPDQPNGQTNQPQRQHTPQKKPTPQAVEVIDLQTQQPSKTQPQNAPPQQDKAFSPNYAQELIISDDDQSPQKAQEEQQREEQKENNMEEGKEETGKKLNNSQNQMNQMKEVPTLNNRSEAEQLTNPNSEKNMEKSELKKDQRIQQYDQLATERITNAFKRQFPSIMRQVSKELQGEPGIAKKRKGNQDNDAIIIGDENLEPKQQQQQQQSGNNGYLQQFMAMVQNAQNNNTLNITDPKHKKINAEQNQLLNFLNINSANINVNNFNINSNNQPFGFKSGQNDKGKNANDAMVID